MAEPIKLTKDEIWFEKTFHVKIASLDKAMQAGGKLHADFIRDLSGFKDIYEIVDKLNPGLKSYNPNPPDAQIKKTVDVMMKAHQSMDNYAKKGDMKGIKQAFAIYVSAYTSLKKPQQEAVDPKGHGVELSHLGGFASR